VNSADNSTSVHLEGEDGARGRQVEDGVSASLKEMASLVFGAIRGDAEQEENPKFAFVRFGSASVMVYDGQTCGVYDSDQLVCRPCTDAELQFAQDHADPGVPI
jgi:hypothetical protein